MSESVSLPKSIRFNPVTQVYEEPQDWLDWVQSQLGSSREWPSIETNYDKVDTFIKAFKGSHDPHLWLRLIAEEVDELQVASNQNDVVEVADAIADIEYVCLGMINAVRYLADSLNIPWQEVFDEVQRSNMMKLWPDGTAHHRDDGKVLKPHTWEKPRIAEILKAHGLLNAGN